MQIFPPIAARYEMNDNTRNARQRPFEGLRRARRPTALATFAALCTMSPIACFNPTAEGETSSAGTTELTGESSSGSVTEATDSAATPTTSGAESSTTADPSASTGEALTTGTTTETTETTGSAIDESFCGDGLVDPEVNEACDDGNFFNDDECTNFCALPVCGDGFVTANETCDDGNAIAKDGCDAACKCERDTCGDGVQDRGEECDDGNMSDRDACSSCCERRFYYVFASSQQFAGKDIGGPLEADASCTALAKAASLPGSYQAWLGSDRGVAAPASLIFPHPYVLPTTGEVVAHSLQELRSGQLATAIHVTEAGEELGALPEDPCMDPAFRAWTGTESDGGGAWNASCANWTDTGLLGRFGAASTAGPTWASCEMEAPCDMMARLYCFEVQQ